MKQVEKNQPRISAKHITTGTMLLTSVALSLLAACQYLTPSSSTSPPTPGDGKSSMSMPMVKSGAQLWSEHCGRCHNVRNPASYSDAQWDVAMLHMRTRANLTKDDYEAVRKFILTAN